MSLHLVLIALAFLFVLMAAVGVPTRAGYNPSWGWLGLTFWLLDMLLMAKGKG
jgi:hypothetical protein